MTRRRLLAAIGAVCLGGGMAAGCFTGANKVVRNPIPGAGGPSYTYRYHVRCSSLPALMSKVREVFAERKFSRLDPDVEHGSWGRYSWYRTKRVELGGETYDVQEDVELLVSVNKRMVRCGYEFHVFSRVFGVTEGRRMLPLSEVERRAEDLRHEGRYLLDRGRAWAEQ
jgi:hypothetical protein